MSNYSEPLVENLNYLVTNEAPILKTTLGTGAMANCAEIWMIDAEADARLYICTKCKMYTGEAPQSVAAHQKIHVGEERLQADILKAWKLLPEPVQKSLLARVRGE